MKELARNNYKAVWNNLSTNYSDAVAHVIGQATEQDIQSAAYRTVSRLEQTVGISSEDVVLEIGCGIGRVGELLAQKCKKWIGCDVSPNMLQFTKERLSGKGHFELFEISGYDLRAIPDNSVDVVYATVVFMHLDEWERYNYILEANRVLRPGGRIYIDNFNLCSDEGWHVFEVHWRIPPYARPPHISKSSTPQELETYLHRAGFLNATIQTDGMWVYGYGTKAESASPIHGLHFDISEHRNRVQYQENQEIQRLNELLQQKNNHILYLESLLKRIENGRLMRILRWLNK